MTEMVRFSFALSSRMQAFIELRNGFSCLDTARFQGSANAWLCAAADIRASLIGDQGRKPALPEISGLLVSMKTHLQDIAKDYPRYTQSIEKACERLDMHMRSLQNDMNDILDWLYNDALISIYINSLKKQDWLGHKPALPQCLETLWAPGHERVEQLHQGLAPLHAAVSNLDQMLHEYVSWSNQEAVDGSHQITPERDTNYGLLVIGLDKSMVASGITPSISGNRLAIRVRFQQWPTGEAVRNIDETIPYSMMLVPFA